ncbi:MAG TPA: hypothetical protein VGW10_18350 [Solirubrobacteraceae bacterium]|nr:hypothetical protein [Solirubrobacteraceae bacterium]
MGADAGPRLIAPLDSPPGSDRRGLRLRRLALVCGMAIATVNIWTGGPLVALWIGSRVQGSGPPSMLGIGIAAVALGVVTYALVRVLARLDAAYGRVAGRTSSVRRHVPWLRSMRGERPHVQKHVNQLSALEIILVTTVVVVVVLFEVWFFFYSPSPIDGRTGRDHDAPIIGLVRAPD